MPAQAVKRAAPFSFTLQDADPFGPTDPDHSRWLFHDSLFIFVFGVFVWMTWGPRSAASGVFEVSPAGPELRLLRNSSIAGRADPWTLDARARTQTNIWYYLVIYI